METWGRDRSREAAALLTASLPDEALGADDIDACLWEDPDPSVVLATEDGTGFVAGVLRPGEGAPVAHLQALAVAEGWRRRGIGSELVASFTRWAADAGASVLVAGAGAPFYLWPGVDFAWTPALCFFEARGFTDRRPSFNMRFPDTFRADAPLGVEVRRVVEAGDAEAVAAFCERHHPSWGAELSRAIESGTAFAAWQDAAPLGFACHSVNRLGWVGPMATDPARRSRGVGGALLSALSADLRALGLGTIEVAWVGPASFYAKSAGAEVSRVFRCLSRRIA